MKARVFSPYLIKKLCPAKIGPQADNLVYEIISSAAVTAVEAGYCVMLMRIWNDPDISFISRIGRNNLLLFGGFLFCMLLSAVTKLRRRKKGKQDRY